MTHKVKCPGEGKETFLCHHAHPGLRSRHIVGAMPCARPVTGRPLRSTCRGFPLLYFYLYRLGAEYVRHVTEQRPFRDW